MRQYDINHLRTPCYLVDLGLLRSNLELLADVQKRTSCKILLAMKGYAAWSTFALCSQYLCGTSASALHEVRLGREYFPGEVHLCAPAYRQDEMDDYLQLVDHIVFNSFTQWRLFRDRISRADRPIECGLRINPMHSEVKTKIYDPCSPGSRLGIPLDQFRPDELNGITGLHFHTLCELNSDSLERTLIAVEQQFGRFFNQMNWVNFGGGHHITRPDYDIDLLCRLITDFADRHDAQVYLEPGEAIALNTGFLIASVLDIVHNAMDIGILDTSASAHMPDVLEMPYRPVIVGADLPGAKKHTYRLAGPTCLAGDVIGDYSFDKPLKVGDSLVFTDMAHYTMVKNTMFNGINLPDIVLYEPDTDTYTVQRRFTYEDFKSRLS
ncbi:MAG: carboxynorspermidine decarboxylase [Sedimentisphaerales bacterium]|nr:carboxynorspermidine decarboxylase [Sedimentisphaerales bacterium]